MYVCMYVCSEELEKARSYKIEPKSLSDLTLFGVISSDSLGPLLLGR